MIPLYENKSREVEYFVTEEGKCPVLDWLKSFKDKTAKSKVMVRIKRASLGNLGDHKYLRDGICEMRIPFGPGLRIYFAITASDELLLLLVGGNKSSQDRDIIKSVNFLKEYKGSSSECFKK
jgi:putative addiction module killer protein